MKLNDYKCDCGTVFEKFSDEPFEDCPDCPRPAARQLGGRPLRAAPVPNMGGFERQFRFTPFGKPIPLPPCEHLPERHIGIGLLETRQVPKAKA